MQSSNVQGFTQSIQPDLLIGPYIDEVVYKVIANQDQRFLALLAGEIEMDTSFFDPVHYQTLASDPDVSIFQAFRNGYSQFTFNCGKYPLNISGLRRAFAFAFNKTEISEVVMEGFAVPHDSLVPLPNGWCIEDQLDWHYYDAQPEIGNQILDDLNFTIDAETGFRLTPKGTAFNILLEYAGCGCHGYETPDAAVAALRSLHIDADVRISDFNDIITRMDIHGDFDMFYYGINFFNNDIDWLAFEFWSEYVDELYQNPCNFANVTYDYWRNQLLYGSTYEEVYEAAAEMQKILHYNVPRLVVGETTYNQAYRNNRFTGHVEDFMDYISGPWTMRKIHKIEGGFGGTVNVAIAEEPDSFNFFVSNSAYSKAITNNLWPSLYKYGPDARPWPDIAETMLTETHSDNPSVPEGHTRFTIDIIQNATWSDGEPLTADDVAFSVVYDFAITVDGSAAPDLGDLVAAYSPTKYRAIIEYSTESYWHFNKFAFNYIIPEHIFNDETGIGYSGWSTWNPVFDSAEPHVTCGPYVFTGYQAGEYYNIKSNPHFHYYPSSPPPDHIQTNPSNNATTNQTTGFILDWNTILVISMASGSTVVIMFCIVLIIRERRNLANI